MSDLIMTVRNPTDKRLMLPIHINGNGTELSHDWLQALTQEIRKQSQLEKNYCWHGWPNGARDLNYLTAELTRHTTRVNNYNETGIWQNAGLDTIKLHTHYTAENVMVHRKGFATNGYDRKFGHLYMHWTQIGKTLMEVFSDEDAPVLDAATCDAITHLQYYSGEFDLEWGRDITFADYEWHRNKILAFNEWLKREGYDPEDPALSLGYLEIGSIDLKKSFGTTDEQSIWNLMGDYLDIYSLQVGTDVVVYDSTWADADHEQKQIAYLMPGYQSHV